MIKTRRTEVTVEIPEVLLREVIDSLIAQGKYNERVSYGGNTDLIEACERSQRLNWRDYSIIVR